MEPQHKLTVQNWAEGRGPAGEKTWITPDGPPVTIRVNIRPVSASESNDLGLQMEDYRVVIYRGRQWPWNAHSTLTWQDVVWDPQGPAVRFTGTSDPFWRQQIRRAGSSNGSGL